MAYKNHFIAALIVVGSLSASVAQSNMNTNNSYPKEVRGYKVHRADVELKKTDATRNVDSSKTDSRKRRSTDEEPEYQQDEPLLVRLGEPKLITVSPLGVTFDVPVIIGAIKQEGDVDRLVFENMRVNDSPVSIDDYADKFKLPNKEPLTLRPPLRIFVSTPQAVMRTIDELLNSKAVWTVTGRVYVCGHFKRFLFKFKRAVPVELDTAIKNPLN